MKKVGAFDAKTHLSQYLTEVARDHTEIVIQRHGKDLAVLKPYEAEEKKSRKFAARRVIEAFREIRETGAVYGSSQESQNLRDEGRKR